ncbi:MAG: NAD-dependent protein deacetylase [Gammaproteobacteria bacterium]|nr:NAD-dependent protein deacetylase [Gammaproteobacteria bacterium]
MTRPIIDPHFGIDLDRLTAFLSASDQVVCLTGAGCSLASGIPTYRTENGDWQGRNTINHQDFLEAFETRQRYWARSFMGWPLMSNAQPNPAHRALTELVTLGKIKTLITQNVDSLHEQAGLTDVQHLHGDLTEVTCLVCGASEPRIQLQTRLADLNTHLELDGEIKPDGDAEISPEVIQQFKIAHCLLCGGTLKPNVVFFGGRVNPALVQSIYHAIEQADALWVIGSSLKLFSGYRFCRHALAFGKPIALLNPGWTRADPIATLKIVQPAEIILPAVLDRLANLP